MAVSYCLHCGVQFPSGGYCYASPDGEHVIGIDGDAVNPNDCCPDCGAELGRAEIDGFAEHVCDPADLAAQKEEAEEFERQEVAELDLHVLEDLRQLCPIHQTETEWIENEAHPEGGYWFCQACHSAEEAEFNSSHQDMAGEITTEEEFNAQLVAMYNLGAVKGKSPNQSKQTTYHSPTKKVKEESKTRRKMAKASRKKNRK